MISFLNELETLGANIDAHTQVNMILNSLPQSFSQFKLNYNMNQINFSMSELMSSFQIAKEDRHWWSKCWTSPKDCKI